MKRPVEFNDMRGFRPFCIVFILIFRSVAAMVKLPFFLKSGYPDHLAPINTSTNPCTNFYAYACESWNTQTKKPPFEPIWNPWISAGHTVKHRIANILAEHDLDLSKPRTFYQSCLRVAFSENKYLNNLISLVEKMGGWPLLKNERENSNYNWPILLANITRDLGIHPVLKIYADLDYKNPTQFVIYIEPGSLIFPQYILSSHGYSAELEAYEKWILESAKHMYGNHSSYVTGVKEIVRFEMKIAKIMSEKSRNERMSIRKLSKKFSCDWLAVLHAVFGDFTQIKPNTTVVVKNYSYLKNLFVLSEKVGSKVVVDYLIWAIVKDLSRETTKHMRNLNFIIDRAVLGVQEDLSREHECLNKIIEYFSSAIIPAYLKLYMGPKVFPVVTKMVVSIKTEFVKILMKSSWLSHEGKQLSVNKVKNIKFYLGYPQKDIFHGQYHRLKISEDHFSNILQLKNIKARHQLALISQNISSEVWPSTPFEVNAYYSILQNAIFIPLGLLQPPFFHPGRDINLNYGALGSLIGHELSHALDPVGIRADSTGKIDKWLSKSDLTLYKIRTNCFGNDTAVGENFADNNGIKISLAALQKYSHHRIRDFFIAFAQMWCEVPDDKDIFTIDTHAVVSERVHNLRRNDEFKQEFRCDGTTCAFW